MVKRTKNALFALFGVILLSFIALAGVGYADASLEIEKVIFGSVDSSDNAFIGPIPISEDETFAFDIIPIGAFFRVDYDLNNPLADDIIHLESCIQILDPQAVTVFDQCFQLDDLHQLELRTETFKAFIPYDAAEGTYRIVIAVQGTSVIPVADTFMFETPVVNYDLAGINLDLAGLEINYNAQTEDYSPHEGDIISSELLQDGSNISSGFGYSAGQDFTDLIGWVLINIEDGNGEVALSMVSQDAISFVNQGESALVNFGFPKPDFFQVGTKYPVKVKFFGIDSADGLIFDNYGTELNFEFEPLEPVQPDPEMGLIVAGLDNIVVNQGENATEEFTVQGTQDISGLNVGCLGGGVICSVQPETLDLTTEVQNFTITIEALQDTEAKDYNAQIMFTSIGYQTEEANFTVTVNDVDFASFQKESQTPTSIGADESGTMTVTLKNVGELNVTLDTCNLVDLTKGSDKVALTNCVLSNETIAVNDTTSFTLDYDAANADSAGTYTGTVNVVDSNNVSHDVALSLNVDKGELEIKKVYLYVDGDKKTVDDGETVQDGDLKPGVNIDIEIVVENTFDSDADKDEIEDIEVELIIEDIDDGKDHDDDYGSFDLDGEKDKEVSFDYTIDEDTEEDTYKVKIHVEGKDEFGQKLEDDFTFKIDVDREVDDLVIKSMKIVPDELGCTKSATLEVTLRNQGSNKLRNVFLDLTGSSLGLSEKISVGTMSKDPDDNSNEITKTLTINKAGKTVKDHVITAKALYDFEDISDVDQVKLTISDCVVTSSSNTNTNTNSNTGTTQTDEDVEQNVQDDIIVIAANTFDEQFAQDYGAEIVPNDVKQSLDAFSDFRNSDTYFIVLLVLVIVICFGIIAGFVVLAK